MNDLDAVIHAFQHTGLQSAEYLETPLCQDAGRVAVGSRACTRVQRTSGSPGRSGRALIQ